MKKHLFSVSIYFISISSNAQVRIVNSTVNSSVTNSPAFIDASSNTSVNNNAVIGKGLVFPRIDLSAFTSFPSVISGIPNSFPTRFDGMIVYNTASSGIAGVGSTMGTLVPGFWYYENKSSSVNGGQWKPIGGNSITVPQGNATTGTIIAVNGQMVVAQQITVQMTADFSTPAATVPLLIGNLNREILDNENRYSGSATGNSFKVSANGTYEIIINAQLSSANGSYPVIGLWNDTTGKWIARVNDTFSAPDGGLQTYTLISSAALLAADTYSFRMANSWAGITLVSQSSGSTGSGPVSQFSVKRMR